MASPYRAIFAAPGTKAFSAAGLFGRMPLSMMGIGIVTMVSQLTGRYGLAGALSATLALSAAVIGPQVSRLVDRYGQRRVLRPATLSPVAAVAGLLVCAQQRLPDWTLFVFAAGAGCVPSVGSMVRARWAEIYRGSARELHTAYSWESIVDEIVLHLRPDPLHRAVHGVVPGGRPAAGRRVPGHRGLLADRAAGHRTRAAPAGAHTGGSALRSRGPPGAGGGRSWPPARSSGRSTW